VDSEFLDILEAGLHIQNIKSGAVREIVWLCSRDRHGDPRGVFVKKLKKSSTIGAYISKYELLNNYEFPDW
jgi:hypothetical protein